MSAFELTDALIPELEKGGDVDFVCLNLPNGDRGIPNYECNNTKPVRRLTNV
jgi:bisphosphoglycerate-independent phosphoglycerate mutase (AlkP superfamily)